MHDAQSRVLVVDDYSDLREVLCERIIRLGYDCQSAASGAAALELASAFQPELVIFEWKLHDGSGRGLSRALRARARQHGRIVHVFAYSTEPEPPDFRAQESVDEYLQKLDNVEDIERLLEQYLRHLH